MKKNEYKNIFVPLVIPVIFIWICLSLPVNGVEAPEKGTIIEKIICENDPGQSYALYLPRDYPGSKKWPILYAFDPAARGRIPLELFKPAAEKYGYIVVGSNNSRNGPTEPIDRAIWAIWRDTHRRFAVEPARIYTTGFSGGARVGSRLHVLTGNACAGIIACGAGISLSITDPERIKPAAWYGIVGLSDFNYIELMDLDAKFDNAGVTHRVHVYEGEHLWPPQNICTRAVEWMEIQAMKKGTREKDDALIKSLYQENLARAHNLELAGRNYYAVDAYETAHLLFDGLLDTSHAVEKITRLKETGAYKTFMKEEDRRRKRELVILKKYGEVLRFIGNIQDPGKPVSLQKMFRELEIDSLLKEARKTDDPYKSGAAYRLLVKFNIGTSRRGREYAVKKEYQKAALFYEIAVKANRKNIFALYNLACAYSLQKQTEKALKNLELAIRYGYRDRAHMEKDSDLDNIRDREAFKELLKGLPEL